MHVQFKDGIRVFKVCSLQICVFLWCFSTMSVTSQPEVTKSIDSTFKDNLSFNLVKMAIACDRNGRKENGYWLLIGKPEENRPLGRPKLRWKHIIKLDLKENERLWSGFSCPNRIT